MELFQLRIEPGSGRAFTPSRGSMVVLTHVALCTSSDDPAVDPNDRITVTVSSNNSTSPIALGSVRASGGNEQFSIGGSGLCFSDASRVEVKHNGKTACVCLTGRIEATSVDMSDSEDDGLEEDTDTDTDEESDSEARTRKLAADAARAYTDANDDEEEDGDSDRDEDSDEDEDEDEEDESEEDEEESDSDEPPAQKKRPATSESDDDASNEDDDESDSDSDDSSSSSDASDEGALPGSKRKSSADALKESRIDDARDAKRGGRSPGRGAGRGRGGRSPAGRGGHGGRGGRSPGGRGGRGGRR